LVVRDAETFARIWAFRHLVLPGEPVNDPVPPVDFATEMVVFVDLGRRPTGGYELATTGVHTAACGIVVEYTETTECVATQSETTPWEAIVVAAAPGTAAVLPTVVGPCPWPYAE
jgi:hypothetical protein